MPAGAFIFGCEGPQLKQIEKQFFADADPWGFILFARNVDTPDQVSRLTSDLRAAVGRDAPILIDQEGGRVARMRGPHWREWVPPLDFAEKMGSLAPDAFRQRYRIIAAELRAIGIDTNCAPMADIASPETHPVLRNRCYGDSAHAVAPIARAVANGLLDGGVLPVLKHCPGHGRAVVDSHLEPPKASVDLPTLQTTDFATFRALADLPAVMTSHVVYEAIDDQPATFSATTIDLLRSDLGINGLLMTDDISMQALSGSPGERAQRARRAGCDLVLHCNGAMDEMELIAAIGPMSKAAEARAKHAENARNDPGPVDLDALVAEFDAISRRAG